MCDVFDRSILDCYNNKNMTEAYRNRALRQEPFLYDSNRRVSLEGGDSGMELKTEGEMLTLGNMFGNDTSAFELGAERVREVYFRTADGDIYWLTGYHSKGGKLVSANKSKKNNDLVPTQLDGEVLGKMSLVIGQPFPPMYNKDVPSYLITEIVAIRPRDPIDNNVGKKNNIKRDFRERLPRRYRRITINDL